MPGNDLGRAPDVFALGCVFSEVIYSLSENKSENKSEDFCEHLVGKDSRFSDHVDDVKKWLVNHKTSHNSDDPTGHLAGQTKRLLAERDDRCGSDELLLNLQHVYRTPRDLFCTNCLQQGRDDH